MEITIERGEVFYRGSNYPWRTDYRCIGPDGTRFQNGSKAELLRVIARKYGVKPSAIIATYVDGSTWRKTP